VFPDLRQKRLLDPDAYLHPDLDLQVLRLRLLHWEEATRLR